MSTENTTPEQNETLRSFLQEELNEAGEMLATLRKRIETQNAGGIRAWFRGLRGRINQDDLSSLEEDYKDKSRRLNELTDEDVRLFLLRREIGVLKEDISALGRRQRWNIPVRAWVLIVVVAFILYFATLAILQGQNQEGIYASATQTASAMPTNVPSPTGTSTPLPTVVP